ncbi:MAG: CoA pyrophosphatase [Propionivibrio sp.]
MAKQSEAEKVLPLGLERLRIALSATPLATSIYLAEDCGEGEDLIPAAVLFSIVLRDHEPSVLLTQRNPDLKDHPGQISFPGGRAERLDGSPADTALREAQEEIGLDPARVEVLGYLPAYRTVTGFRVTPVVAIVRPPFTLRPDPGEVAEVFEVPLSFLLDSANHQRRTMQIKGQQRDFYAVPYGERFIWGATAGIILGLVRLLASK